jgi:hypothetical protein
MKPVEPKDPIAWVGQFEKEIGLPGSFFLNLLVKEDDWSFIIKLHALVEAAVSHLLATICGDKLLGIFTRLELSSDTVGKLAFAKVLDVLDSDERTFIRKLSEIRNSFAHDVRQAGATLAAYVARLNKDQLKALKVAIGPGVDPFPIADTALPELEFVRDNPKVCIWLRALFVISFIYQRKDLVLLKRKAADEREKLLATVLEVDRLRREFGAKLAPHAKETPRPDA